jgi:hypothetical protein
LVRDTPHRALPHESVAILARALEELGLADESARLLSLT